jgi:hypothetical protein
MVQEPVEVIDVNNVNIVDNVSMIRPQARVSGKHFIDRTALNCCFLNARGLLNKLDELKLWIIDSKLDIIDISETWLNGDIII